MFSVQQKRDIADAVQKVLRDTGHPELPATEIQFRLMVNGAESWSWADIRNNGAVPNPDTNPWNERQASVMTTALSEVIPAYPNNFGDGVDAERDWWRDQTLQYMRLDIARHTMVPHQFNLQMYALRKAIEEASK